MKITLHMCMPEGDAMRNRFGELMEIVKRDNRAVIAAMLAEGLHVPDTVGELDLRYLPEQHRLDEYGQPIMNIYGYREMVQRRTFSCGDAAAFEAAVVEEKYGVRTLCVAVSQGDDDLHGVFVTETDAIDPTANFLEGRRSPIPVASNPVEGSACHIEDGRVVCEEDDICAVDEHGVWRCAPIPGLHGRRVLVSQIQRSSNGSAWARTSEGVVVPVRRDR